MLKKILTCMLCLGLSHNAMADADAVDYPVKGAKDPDAWTVRKGLRFGYNYVNKGENSVKLESPHLFAIGFESQQAMSGGSCLDLLFIQNITISGLEQSVMLPSANALVGFEINKKLQLAVGANGTIVDPSGEDRFVHLVTAIGWTQDAALLSVPIHLVYIPDVSDYYRIAATTGVNW
jgi:hypothetical protein